MVLDSIDNKKALHTLGKTAMTRFYQNGHELAAKLHKFELAKTLEEQPVIPAPEIFNFESSSDSSSTFSGSTLLSGSFRLPLISECAAHLELLEVFFVLRQCILRSPEIDAAMGIEPIRETKTGRNGDTKTLKDKTLWHRRQDKWPKFLEFAVVRFLQWRKALLEKPQDHFYLPPLDVIMVWHSFMLNPRLFQNHCKAEPLYKLRMPWEKIHDSIDNNEWHFNHHADAARHFETNTGLAPDLFDQLSSWVDPTSGTSDAEPQVPMVKLTAYNLEDLTAELRMTIESLDPNHQASKYMSHFQDVDKDLAIQLKEAVIRQTAFVDKMNAHMWIRSPALQGTLRRGIERYDKFLKLLKLYPSTTVVPTLDIDLAWHTHQCSPSMYAKGMKERVGRFINHDDSIVKDKLDDGFAKSRKYFRIHFGQEYRLCGCWDCEVLMSEIEEGTAAAAATETGEELDMPAIVKRVDERVMYFRFAEFSRRQKKPLPVCQP
ncbi:hypothetical protein B0T24DRAFT_627414 [Lasiosphaeria ovina]|uniref:Glycine-rich domain-containing protein 1 n=1 Tax=Lasiosphaeria ovina TaxID=92902 RepID=A0AAE0K6I2_9PEZI|nr:hypothetical protein B0T24DRAFT_627414 [Lasiosphaeria ovina]